MDKTIKDSIKIDLENDIQAHEIVEKYNLTDADEIYEVLGVMEINNRYMKSTKKWITTKKLKKLLDYDDILLLKIESIMKQCPNPKIRILEQGCGDGTLANRVAQRFPECSIVGIDLSHGLIEKGKEKYNCPNLVLQQADGYKFTDREKYDIIYHINVLEHVPDPESYILAGINLLNNNGILLINFPKKTYWKFWGFPKYLACLLLSRKFQTHSQNEHLVTRFLKKENKPFSTISHGLYWPRRLYIYIPNFALSAFGLFLEWVEILFHLVSIKYPTMFSFYEISNNQEPVKGIKYLYTKNISAGDIIFVSLLSPLLIVGFVVTYIFSYLLLAMEILKGRKSFFKQV